VMAVAELADIGARPFAEACGVSWECTHSPLRTHRVEENTTATGISMNGPIDEIGRLRIVQRI
jgi:hypothetical protein